MSNINKTSFVIEGELVYRIHTEVKEMSDGSQQVIEKRSPAVHINDWFDTIKSQIMGTDVVIPALPNGCGRIAAIKEKNGRQVVAVELAPGVHNLRGKFNSGNGKEKLYKISMPFLVVVMSFKNGAFNGEPYIYYRNAPIFSGQDDLFFCNLPNVYEDAQLCWGGSGITSGKPLQEQITEFCKSFWQSCFNMHEYGYHFEPSSKLEGHPKDFEQWQEMTAQNPSFIMGINWRPAGKTLAQKMEEMVK